jgi:hypothetical protein
VIACFRKVQDWGYEAIVNEYRGFAGEKARPLDEASIGAYTPGRGIQKTAKRLKIASWVVVPDQLKTNAADEDPAPPGNKS